MAKRACGDHVGERRLAKGEEERRGGAEAVHLVDHAVGRLLKALLKGGRHILDRLLELLCARGGVRHVRSAAAWRQQLYIAACQHAKHAKSLVSMQAHGTLLLVPLGHLGLRLSERSVVPFGLLRYMYGAERDGGSSEARMQI